MAEVVAPVVTQQPVAPVAPIPAAPQVSAPETAPAEAPKPERTFSQAELDEIIEKRLSKERRKREDIERRLKVTEELALKGRDREAAAPKPAEQPSADEPKREQFAVYEEYIEARAAWRADKAVESRLTKDREAQNRERQATEAKKAGDDFRKRLKDSAKGIEDFDDIVADATASPDSPVSRIAADPIQQADNPARILVHLAQNPEEAERIASLPLGQQAREIWKLDAQMGAKAPDKKPSAAPEPIKPVGGKATVGDAMPDPAKEPEKWLRWRNAQIAARTAKARAA